MIQKFKITACAFILVLLGSSLMTVSSVLAHNAEAEDLGDHTHEHGEEVEETCYDEMDQEIDCIRSRACDALRLQIEEISASLKHKDARIAHLHEQYSIALLESIEKDETIADLTDRFAQHAQAQAELYAIIAELQNQLSTAHSEVHAHHDGIPISQLQCINFDQLYGDQDDEVCWIQTSGGLWYDEAIERCSSESTPEQCVLYLNDLTHHYGSFVYFLTNDKYFPEDAPGPGTVTLFWQPATGKILFNR